MESLIVWNIVRNGSLCRNVVFEKEVIFQDFDFETSELGFGGTSRNEASESTQLRVTTVFFSSIISRNCDDQLRPNVQRFVILCICWDIPSDNLRQLPIVSSALNRPKWKPTQSCSSHAGTEKQKSHESQGSWNQSRLFWWAQFCYA